MSKRALLVGCNYPGTNAALNGCINDVWGTKEMLIKYFGFQEPDITVMIDTDAAYTKPTGAAIKAKLSELVAQSVGEDLIVFHFSGHGTQVPSADGDEHDGKDEAICPADMNVMTDDDFRIILAPLAQKPGVKFTFLADCCHSGTLIDHQSVVISGQKEGGPAPPAVDVQAIQNMLAALGAGGNREVKNRALPFSDLASMLSSLLGGQEVNASNVRSSLGTVFGADASAKIQAVMKYADMAKSALAMLQGKPAGDGAAAPKAEGGFGGLLSACLGACMSGNESTPAPAAAPAAAAPPKPLAAGAKPPPGEQLPDEVGILITGCQDRETSADACPSGDASKAHGALSNALHTVVRQHYEANPGTPLTYRNLVIAVREALAKSGFAQNPCLECSVKWADAEFITCKPAA